MLPASHHPARKWQRWDLNPQRRQLPPPMLQPTAVPHLARWSPQKWACGGGLLDSTMQRSSLNPAPPPTQAHLAVSTERHFPEARRAASCLSETLQLGPSFLF